MPAAPRLATAFAALAVLAAACGEDAPPAVPAPPPAVLVSLPAADAVELLASDTGEVRAHTEVGMLPHRLVASPDGTRAWVALTGSQAVAELDTRTGALLRTLRTEAVPETRADGTRIEGHFTQDAFAQPSCYACHGRGRVKPAVVGARPFGLALSEDGRTLFVSHLRGAKAGALPALVALDLASGQETARAPLAPAGAAVEPTALARLGDTLFVSILPVLPSAEPGVVRRLDARTLAVLGPDTPVGPNAGTLVADAARGEVYASHFETNAVSTLAPDGSVRARTTVGNGPMGTEPGQDGLLWVANYYDHSLSRVELSTGAVVTQPLAHAGKPLPNPTHVRRHGTRLYALSGGTTGALMTLDPDTLALERVVPAAGLPFDLLVVPDSVSNTQQKEDTR